MARLTIDTGTEGNPATGDTLRGAMTKINTNFEEDFGLVGSDNDTGLIKPTLTNSNLILQPNGTGIIEVDKLSINDASITSTVTNGDITITANGTGDIVMDGDLVVTVIKSDDSTQKMKIYNLDLIYFYTSVNVFLNYLSYYILFHSVDTQKWGKIEGFWGKLRDFGMKGTLFRN